VHGVAEPLLRGSHLRGDIEAECRDAAGVGLSETETHADRRRLAGPVRADHAQAFACMDLERERIDHLAGAEGLRQLHDAQQRFGHGIDSGKRYRQRERVSSR